MIVNQHQSLLVRHINIDALQVQVTDMMCYLLVILGLVGNVLGLFIFSSSRRTWRISSTYACLATCNSITNLLCVIRYASILHSTTRHLLHQFIGQTWWACKFYELSFSIRVISSWITLFWMFERLMCVSRRLRRIFHRWCSFELNFVIPIIMIIFILAGVIGPSVYMYEPAMDSTVQIMNCGVNSNASLQWQIYFHEVHLGRNHFTVRCLFSELIPTGAILLFNFYIIYYIIRIHRHLRQKNVRKPRKEQSRTASWMNIVLILHSLLFLSSLLSHIVGHFVVVEAHETWWVLLTILVNCSLNFYIYCLSGKAFRNEIRRFIQQLKTRIFNSSQTRQQPSYQNQRFIYPLSNGQEMIPL